MLSGGQKLNAVRNSETQPVSDGVFRYLHPSRNLLYDLAGQEALVEQRRAGLRIKELEHEGGGTDKISVLQGAVLVQSRHLAAPLDVNNVILRQFQLALLATPELVGLHHIEYNVDQPVRPEILFVAYKMTY